MLVIYMKKAKIKKTEEKKEVKLETEYSFKQLMKILIVIVLIFGMFYLITLFLIKPSTDEAKNPVVVDNSKQKDSSLPFYYIDLDDGLNKKYLSEKMNITNEMKNLKLSDEVLFKIKEGKIEKTYIGNEEIIDKLSRL